MVADVGLEPTRHKPAELKPAVSSNSTNPHISIRPVPFLDMGTQRTHHFHSHLRDT